VLWLAPESLLECRFTEASEVYGLALGSLEVLSHGIHPHTALLAPSDTLTLLRAVRTE
jgi:hypothetical protein